jgi:hypothetical protein
MTITLQLKAEVEAGLRSQAEASGKPLQEYLLALVEEAAVILSPGKEDNARVSREQAVRAMLEFGGKHKLSLGEPLTRELLHEGHRF